VSEMTGKRSTNEHQKMLIAWAAFAAQTEFL
jgi:hypothetical protein